MSIGTRLARARRMQSGRPGFTVIEVLVVIAIIATLVGLLLAAVQRARDVGTRTSNFDEISQIAAAIGTAKQKLHLECIPPGPFHLKQTYTNSDPELGYLLTAFPQMGWQGNLLGITTNGLPNGTDIWLDSNQTLCLFLTGGIGFTPGVASFDGFSTNPTFPFQARKSAAETRIGPFLQPVAKYLSTTPASLNGQYVLSSTVSPVLTASGITNVTVTVGGQNPPQAWLVDQYGLPFAYFAPINGKANLYSPPPGGTTSVAPIAATSNATAQGYQLVFKNGATSTVYPYFNNTAFVSPTGPQIISSGKDCIFGIGGFSGVPATGTGTDDQANFTTTVLGGGIN